MWDTLTYFFPATFLTLAAAHFVALLSPGPDFFLIVGHAVRARLRGSAFICAGIALGNAFYIALAIAGWAGLKNSPAVYRAIEVAGMAYLGWMGYLLVRSSLAGAAMAIETEGRAGLNRKQQFGAGLASALLNPKNAIFYLSLMTGIIGPGATLTQLVTAGAWMVTVVLLWDLAVAAGISHPLAQAMLKEKIPVIERIAGIVLLAVAAGILWTVVRNPSGPLP